jgi:hypothetical protein
MEDIMKFLSGLGIASLVVLATSCASTNYGTRSSRDYDANDFNGDWQLVAGRSDNGHEWLHEKTRFDIDWGTSGDVNTDHPRYGAWFLPEVIRISGDRDALRIEGEGGELIAAVDLNNDMRVGTYNGSDTDRDTDRDHVSDADQDVHTHWVNNHRFQVQRYGRNGRRVTQMFDLQHHGRELVVYTEIERDSSTRSFTRVYNRA